MKIKVKANSTNCEKVGDFYVSKDELTTDLRDRLSIAFGIDVIPHKGGEPLPYATLSGAYNKIGEEDEISVKAYEKIFPPKEDDALGPKYSIMVLQEDSFGTNTFSEYMHYNENIGKLKERIATRIEIPPSEFTLWRREVLLDENKTPRDYEMGTATRIHARITNPQASGSIQDEEMEQTDNENSIELILKEGEMGLPYEIPLNATPRDILSNYAEYKKNSMYNMTYALYNGTFMLPMDKQFEELIQNQYVKKGDILEIGPSQPITL